MGVTRTRAAMIHEAYQPWEIVELDLDEPKAGEALVRFVASGMCRDDEHARVRNFPFRYPMVCGHEGAGVVEEVGPAVTRVRPGDHVVTSFIAVCGRCRYCSAGHQNLCGEGPNPAIGWLADNTFRFHRGADDVGGMCSLGTSAQYAVVSERSLVPIDDDIPFEVAALLGCGVTTGWGSVAYVAAVRPDDAVVVFGVGGVGLGAVQAARHAGAKCIVAVDPIGFKLDLARELGATHVSDDPAQAADVVGELTGGRLADHAIVAVGVLTPETAMLAVGSVGKLGQVTIAAYGKLGGDLLQVPAGFLVLGQKRIVGSVYGGANPTRDIPALAARYRSGELRLDELITARYSLDQINDGYRDLVAGRTLRGVLVHEH